MPLYTSRIELNGPPGSSVYDAVHDALFNAGYKRWILGERGGYWKLPDGMYVGWSQNIDMMTELEHVKSIVRPIWQPSEIIVFKYSEAAWNGLERLTDDTQ